MRVSILIGASIIALGAPVSADPLDLTDTAKPEKKCGSYIGDVCAKDEWCDYPDADPCSVRKSLGTCKLRPRICGRIYMPVCGCNGKTHGNGCEAKAAGTDVLHTGKCFEAFNE